jgi:hypothetical protein
LIETNRQQVWRNLGNVTQASAKNMPQFLSGELSLTGKQTGSSRKQGKRWLFLHQYFFTEQSPSATGPAPASDHKFSSTDESAGD